MNYRITDLKNFVEISGCRTMREGAEKLQISQPALSESIKRLEEDLGERLFYRARSGIALTPAGQEIERKARRALDSLNEVAGTKSSDSRRLITLGCHETVGSYFLPQFYRRFEKDQSFQFRVRHGLSRNVQLDIQQGRTDIGIVVNPIPSPDLVIRTIATDEICVWQTSNLSADNTKIFCNLGINQTHSILKKWKHKPAEIVEMESLELIARITEQGVGFGIAPKRLIDLLGFKKLRLAEGAPTYKDQFSLVYRPEFGKNPSEKHIIEQMRRAFEE